MINGAMHLKDLITEQFQHLKEFKGHYKLIFYLRKATYSTF